MTLPATFGRYQPQVNFFFNATQPILTQCCEIQKSQPAVLNQFMNTYLPTLSRNDIRIQPNQILYSFPDLYCNQVPEGFYFNSALLNVLQETLVLVKFDLDSVKQKDASLLAANIALALQNYISLEKNKGATLILKGTPSKQLSLWLRGLGPNLPSPVNDVEIVLSIPIKIEGQDYEIFTPFKGGASKLSSVLKEPEAVKSSESFKALQKVIPYTPIEEILDRTSGDYSQFWKQIITYDQPKSDQIHLDNLLGYFEHWSLVSYVAVEVNRFIQHVKNSTVQDTQLWRWRTKIINSQSQDIDRGAVNSLEADVYALIWDIIEEELSLPASDDTSKVSEFGLDIEHVIQDSLKGIRYSQAREFLSLEELTPEKLDKVPCRKFWDFHMVKLIRKVGNKVSCIWTRRIPDDFISQFRSKGLSLIECLSGKVDLRQLEVHLKMNDKTYTGFISNVEVDQQDRPSKIEMKKIDDNKLGSLTIIWENAKPTLVREVKIQIASLPQQTVLDANSQIFIYVPNKPDAFSNYGYTPKESDKIMIHFYLTNLVFLLSKLLLWKKINAELVKNSANLAATAVACCSVSWGYRWVNTTETEFQNELSVPIVQKEFSQEAFTIFSASFKQALKSFPSVSKSQSNLNDFLEQMRNIPISEAVTFGQFECFCNNYRSPQPIDVKPEDIEVANLLSQSQWAYFRSATVRNHDVLKMIYVFKKNQEIRLANEPLFGSRQNRPTHSQLSRGASVLGAGEMFFEKDGSSGWHLTVINNGSGHYRPPANKSLKQVLNKVRPVLEGQGINVTRVRLINCLKPGLPYRS